MKIVLKFSKFFLIALLVPNLVFAAGSGDDECEPPFTPGQRSAAAPSRTRGTERIVIAQRDWRALSPEQAVEALFSDLAGGPTEGSELFEQFLLKIRKKIHSKKGFLTWIEMTQSLSAIRRTFEAPLSRLRAYQINLIRLGIMQKALALGELQQEIKVRLANELFGEFKKTLRRPQFAKALEKMQTTPAEFASVFKIAAANGLTAEQVAEHNIFTEMRSIKQDGFNSIRQSLIVAYRTRASRFRRTLTLNQYYYGILEKFPHLRETQFNLSDLSYLVGDGFINQYTDENVTTPIQITGAVRYPAPFEFKLFNGIRDLYTTTRRMYPAQFERVVDLYEFDANHHQEILNAFQKHRRMIVTWAAPRVEIDEGMFDAMIRYADEQDAFIVVVPEAGQPMELDPRLYKHPLVHICVNTIEFSPWMKLNMLPLPGKRIDPLSNLRAPGRGGDRGVVNIIGHPQMRDEILPTADNELFKHRLLTTGAITKPWYNSRFIIGHVTDQQARDVHVNGFLVVEKDKATSGFDGEGVPNTFHTRHIEYIPETTSFIDLGRRYTPNGSTEVRPQVMVAGDDHVAHEHLEFARAKVDIIRRYRPRVYVTHDVFDGTAINHWEASDPLIMARKAASGELNLVEELTKVVHFVNAILALDPEVQVVIPDANHNEWLVRLLKEMDDLGQPINDPIVAELWSAWHNHGVRPLEYFLLERSRIIMRDPDRVRRSAFVPGVSDPTRVTFIDAGQSYKIGPENRLVEIGEHGHHSGGLSKGSLTLRMSAGRAFNSIVFGHTHSSGRNFRSVNAGASIGAGTYAIGGPSAVDMGFVFVYADGSIQLHHFDEKSLTYALEGDEVAPATSYTYTNTDAGISYPRVIQLEDRRNLETLDQFRSWPRGDSPPPKDE